MKRRGFLGIMGGAVVAGPGAAKQAVTAASTAGTAGVARMPYLGSTVGSEGPSDNDDWVQSEIKRLKRLLSFGPTDEEMQRRELDADVSKYAFEIETSGLRSMSEQAKIRRMKHYAVGHEAVRERRWAKLQLAKLMKRAVGFS